MGSREGVSARSRSRSILLTPTTLETCTGYCLALLMLAGISPSRVGYALVIVTIGGPLIIMGADVKRDNKTRIQLIRLLVKERKKEVTRQGTLVSVLLRRLEGGTGTSPLKVVGGRLSPAVLLSA